MNRSERDELYEVIRKEIRACSLSLEAPVMQAPPPADLDAERHLLSSMWEGDAPPRWLKAEHFSRHLHEHVFAVLCEMLSAQKEPTPIDTSAVLKTLATRGFRPTKDMVAEVRCLETYGWCELEPLAKRIVEMSRRRESLPLMARYDALVRVPSTTTDELLSILSEAQHVLAPRQFSIVRRSA